MSETWTLVTGASSGIGEAIARMAAAEREKVILTARSADRLEQIATELRDRHQAEIAVIPADLAAADGPDTLWRQATEGRRIGTLVNNAGLGRFGDFGDGEADGAALEDASMAVNVVALTKLSRLAVAHMREAGGGRMLLVASTVGFMPGPGMAVYGATKAYVVSLSHALRAELQGSGITVTCVCPGVTETNFQAVAGMTDLEMLKTAPKQSAAEVAAFAWEAMKRGRGVVVPGLTNRAVVLGGKMAPHGLMAWAMRRAMR